MKKSKFKSNFETDIAISLRSRLVDFEYEPKGFAITIQKNYWPDFYFPDKDFYVETKGFLDKDSKEKLLAFKKDYPKIDLRIVFQEDNYLCKLSKTSRAKRLDKSKKGGKLKKREKYSDWAKKHGFKYAIGRIPEEWINNEE